MAGTGPAFHLIKEMSWIATRSPNRSPNGCTSDEAAQESNGAVVRWLDRLGYRADPSDVDIIVSRYAQERDATRACLRLTST